MPTRAFQAIVALALLGGGCGSRLISVTESESKVDSCPRLLDGTPKENKAEIPSKSEYEQALKGLNMTAVKEDMSALLRASKRCWPADKFKLKNGKYGESYGPFMIRLAWHCSGTFRSDGRGGCGGGRQRFEPERSFEDNTNLDKARALVAPLKRKYGHALSWGDLFILAGTTALRDSGATVSKMCFGRVDEKDGSKSKPLGKPCKKDDLGLCQEPFGTEVVGLIYVNPEGLNAKGEVDPKLTAEKVRETFERMGQDDEATVALIGGGHTLGKTHGACKASPGLSPAEAFKKRKPIWQSKCKGTVTSGFEGPWTHTPLEWGNSFFKDLLNYKWKPHVGQGGKMQYYAEEDKEKELMRLTSDIALLEDKKYLSLVKKFARSPQAFDRAFDKAWEQLTTLNVGGEWAKNARCDDGKKPPRQRKGQLKDDA